MSFYYCQYLHSSFKVHHEGFLRSLPILEFSFWFIAWLAEVAVKVVFIFLFPRKSFIYAVTGDSTIWLIVHVFFDFFCLFACSRKLGLGPSLQVLSRTVNSRNGGRASFPRNSARRYRFLPAPSTRPLVCRILTQNPIFSPKVSQDSIAELLSYSRMYARCICTWNTAYLGIGPTTHTSHRLEVRSQCSPSPGVTRCWRMGLKPDFSSLREICVFCSDIRATPLTFSGRRITQDARWCQTFSINFLFKHNVAF